MRSLGVSKTRIHVLFLIHQADSVHISLCYTIFEFFCSFISQVENIEIVSL